jgi:predicted Zn finger-like uncharacterized protein
MILTCTKCATRYHVDPTSLSAEGRLVRCAGCGHRWTARPPADPLKPLDSPTLSPASRRPGAAAAQRSSPRVVTWLVAALVVLVAASAVIGRNEVVARFPASAAVYEALRMPVGPRRGLTFEDVTSKQLVEGGVTVLVVEGGIVNQSKEAREVPPIRVILLDDGGRQLQGETFSSKEASLGAGAKTTFSGRLVNPPNQARNFSITFDLDS